MAVKVKDKIILAWTLTVVKFSPEGLIKAFLFFGCYSSPKFLNKKCQIVPPHRKFCDVTDIHSKQNLIYTIHLIIKYQIISVHCKGATYYAMPRKKIVTAASVCYFSFSLSPYTYLNSQGYGI